MYVGSLGDIPFIVARGFVRTFDDYSRSNAGRWAKHELIGQKPILEYLGPDTEKISFTMQLRADLGVIPEKEVEKLRELRDEGKPMVLVLGTKPVGDNSWIVESIGEAVTFWGMAGYPLSINVDVTLTEYVERS